MINNHPAMQKIIRFYVLFLALIIFPVVAQAAVHGYDHKAHESYYTVTSGVVAVRAQPSSTAKLLYNIYGGDDIYVDDGKLYEDASKSKWIKVSGQDAYVPLLRLTRVNNPEYERPVDTPESLLNLAPIGMFIAIIAVFFLITGVLIWLAATKWHWIKPFTGLPDIKLGGMRKILFYNKEPYVDCLIIAGIVAASFVITILLFLLLGAIAIGGGWVFKILCYIVAYLLIIIGYGMGVAGGYNAILGDADGCGERIGYLIGGVLGFVLGSNALEWRSGIIDFGQTIQEWGGSVMVTFNILDLAWELVLRYWKYVLIVSLVPLVLLSVCGLGFMLFNYVLILSEKASMRRYNVKNPCPHCGVSSEPAIYYSEGVPLPVDLLPGRYGIYHITHPITGERMPTRFANGKALLERECPHCHMMINAQVGEEKHVAFAGVSGSGKSSLMYRILGTILDKRIGGEPLAIRSDNNNSADDRQFDYFHDSIKDGKAMEEFPNQTTRGRHKALQLMMFNPQRKMSYRVYFNDIAGETFTAANMNIKDAPFLQNTDLVIFMLDPLSIPASSMSPSPAMKEWLASHKGNPSLVGIDESLDRLINLIDNYKKGGAASMDLIVNLGRSDLGYIKCERTSDKLRAFVDQELGLERVTSRLEQTFRSVRYYAVSAKEEVTKSGINWFIEDIFKTVGVSYKGASGEKLRECREDYERQVKERNEERERVLQGLTKNRKGTPAIMASVIALIVAAVVMGGWLLASNLRKDKVEQVAVRKVETLMSSDSPQRYRHAVIVLDQALEKLPASSSQAKSLSILKEDVQREYQTEVDGILSMLYANFVPQTPGSLSNLEVCAKYGVMDSIESVKEKLDLLHKLAPDNEQYASYLQKFRQVLKKYHITNIITE